MATQDRYAPILNTVIEITKESSMENPGSDEAMVCYDLTEAAISEAEMWEIPLEEQVRQYFSRKLKWGPSDFSRKNDLAIIAFGGPDSPCVRATPPHHRILDAGYIALLMWLH